MVNISQITKHLLEEKMLLDEYLKQGIINYIALAEKFRPRIEKELGGKKIKTSTIAMALRRHCEKNTSFEENDLPSLKDSELLIRGNLCDIVVNKSPTLFIKLKNIYSIIDYNKGEVLNIVHGNFDVSIIINERLKQKVITILKDEKILHIEEHLVALTIRFDEHFLYHPGITFSILKQLVLVKVNLIEIISTLIEITFIVNKNEAVKGFNALQEFLEKNK